MNLDKDLLTADEAAIFTGLKPATLRKLAWQRRIRSFKVLGCLRFRRRDLESLIVERPKVEAASSVRAVGKVTMEEDR